VFPKVIRDALVRAIEWRAGRIDDPANRLQFLRRNVGLRTVSVSSTRVARYGSLTLVTIGILLAVGWFWTSSRQVMVAAADSTRTLALSRLAVPAPAILTKDMPDPAGKVWLVQTTPQFDLYSNGLRIEERFATSTAPRRYVAFAADHFGTNPVATNAAGGMASAGEWRSDPAGIVYHTTESNLARFEESENQSLRRAGEGLLEYVSRRHSYHFVIDRFGRVFRIVRETDYANHAGNSVWADQYWVYINLNQSFFGVAFEAHSRPRGLEAAVNAAQIYAGRILTDMLRARYRIAPSNCVAHAQVSVNPQNFGVGYHLDWAARLPFAELGLADNYRTALPSVRLFGFATDAARIGTEASSGAQGMTEGPMPGMTDGLEAAEAQVRAEAAAQNLPLERYRAKLHQRYRDAIRALRGKGAYQEYN
jgi:N-acetylmuramoyl-L-alanine amidase